MFEDNVIVTFEIQSMKAKIMSMLQLRNKDIEQKIDVAITQAFNKESINQMINYEVEQAIHDAIKRITKTYTIQIAVEELVVEAIKAKTKTLKPKSKVMK